MHTRKIWIVSPQQARQAIIADVCVAAGASRENIRRSGSLLLQETLADERPEADIVVMDYPYKMDAMDPALIESIRPVFPPELFVIAITEGDGYDAAKLHLAGADYVIQTKFATQSEELGHINWRDLLKFQLRSIMAEAPILH